MKFINVVFWIIMLSVGVLIGLTMKDNESSHQEESFRESNQIQQDPIFIKINGNYLRKITVMCPGKQDEVYLTLTKAISNSSGVIWFEDFKTKNHVGFNYCPYRIENIIKKSDNKMSEEEKLIDDILNLKDEESSNSAVVPKEPSLPRTDGTTINNNIHIER